MTADRRGGAPLRAPSAPLRSAGPLLFCALLAFPAAARAAEPQWGRVVAGLQLVAEEYTEALELEDPAALQKRREQLAALLDQLGPLVPEPGVRAQVSALRPRVLSTDYRLAPDCRALIADLVARTGLVRTPLHKPSLARGQRLYAQSCAACHGSDGTGRTPLSATMDPPPPDILHPQVNWSPYEMYNRVSWGGAETAMPAFDPGLSARDRWDLVFFLFAARWPKCEPARAAALPALDAAELALLGDFELGNRFGYGAAACLRRNFTAPRKPTR